MSCKYLQVKDGWMCISCGDFRSNTEQQLRELIDQQENKIDMLEDLIFTMERHLQIKADSDSFARVMLGLIAETRNIIKETE